jgi:hypothetical protein
LDAQSDTLQQIAARVADCFSESGYAFIEDNMIDSLAVLLGSFLTVADIPVNTPVADPAPNEDPFTGWSTHTGSGWPLYNRETVLP